MIAPANIGKSEADYRRYELLSCLSRTPPPSSKPGRIVTLASVSRRVPADLVGDLMAQTIRANTGRAVLLVRISPREIGVALSRAHLHSHGGEEFSLAEHLHRAEGGFQTLAVRVSEAPLERNHVAALLEECRRHFQFVLLQVDPEVPVPLTVEFAARADVPYLLFHQTTDCLYHFSVLYRELRTQWRGAGTPIKPVLCVEAEEAARVGLDFARQLGCPVHAMIHGTPRLGAPTESLAAFEYGVRSLAREVARCRVGLALSSGAAKGLAHVGIIQVLEEMGVEIDVVAGCSMGAYVGALWAFGHDGKFLNAKARELEGRFGLWKLVDPVLPPRQGFLRGLSVKNRLKKSIGDAHFADLLRPMRIVATHFETLERVVFSSGEVATAVHASSAIPGACVPVEINGETYMDGGISDPLPVDVLKEMGVERIIAVNTIPTPAYLRCSLEMEREQRHGQPHRRGFWKFLNQQINYFARGNILDIMQSSILGAQIRNAEEACRAANLVLRPLACDGSWHDFTHPMKYVALGRHVAEEHSEEIRALLRPPEAAYENQSTPHALATAA